MKNKYLLSLMILLNSVLMITGCTFQSVRESEEFSNRPWEQQYENIFDDTLIVEKDIDEVISIVQVSGGIIILSSPDCPDCQRVLPVLDELSQQYKNVPVYYVDVKDMTQDKRNEYREFFEDIFIENSDNTLSILVPDVYVISQGEILDHQQGHLSDLEEYELRCKALFEKSRVD